MVVEEKRSPELILEYFGLLKWWNGGGEVSEDEVLPDESVDLILQKMAEGRRWISSLEETISHNRDEVQDLAYRSNQLASQISICKQEINNLERDKIRIQSEVLPSSSSPEEPFFNVPELHPKQRFILLVASFNKDLNLLASSLPKFFSHLMRSNIIVSVIYISFFSSFTGLLLLSLIKSNLAINILGYFLFLLYLIYLHKKLHLIDREYEQHWRHEAIKKLATHRQNIEEGEKIKLQQQKQELDKKIETERSKLHLLELDQNNFSVLHQQKMTTMKENLQKASSLNNSLERWEQSSQERIAHLKTEKRFEKEKRLRYLDHLAERWLNSDVDSLTRRAMRRFKVKPSDEIHERYTLRYEPIRILVGRTERINEKFDIGISSGENQNSPTPNEKLLIDPEDYSISGISMNKRKRYGVYEFTVILLCANFLSYYKCYWNFIRKTRINDESCEYLYDSIVSVKVRERSSARLKDRTRNRVYEKSLLLSTKDGKELRLRVAENRIDRTHSLKLSQVDEAAMAIRDMLRQRRIDVLFVKDIERSQSGRDMLN